MEVIKTIIKCILILLVNVYTVKGQQDTISNPRLRSCWEVNDRVINNYADSLNFLNIEESLPTFLEDYLMDWRFRKSMYPCLKNYHEVISFRKGIIDRVIREDVLELIVNSKNEKYDLRYEPEIIKKEREINSSFQESFPAIKYMEKSWRSLAKKRLDEVKELKKN